MLAYSRFRFVCMLWVLCCGQRLKMWPWVSTLPLNSNNDESLWLYFRKLCKNKKGAFFTKYKTLQKASLEPFDVTKKSKPELDSSVCSWWSWQERYGGWEGCARPAAVSSASPSSSTWQVALGGHEPSATAIILERLFHSDQILRCKCRSLVGATFN